MTPSMDAVYQKSEKVPESQIRPFFVKFMLKCLVMSEIMLSRARSLYI